MNQSKSYATIKSLLTKTSVNIVVKLLVVVILHVDAARHGISRALVAFDEQFRTILKPYGLLTRDARSVERKKYGKKKARKSSQFSKDTLYYKRELLSCQKNYKLFFYFIQRHLTDRCQFWSIFYSRKKEWQNFLVPYIKTIQYPYEIFNFYIIVAKQVQTH